MKLIVKLNDKISIYAESNSEYIVKIHNNTWYLPDLQSCMQEILEYVLRNRLMLNEKKDMETIIKIINEVHQEVKNVLHLSTKDSLKV